MSQFEYSGTLLQPNAEIPEQDSEASYDIDLHSRTNETELGDQSEPKTWIGRKVQKWKLNKKQPYGRKDSSTSQTLSPVLAGLVLPSPASKAEDGEQRPCKNRARKTNGGDKSSKTNVSGSTTNSKNFSPPSFFKGTTLPRKPKGRARKQKPRKPNLKDFTLMDMKVVDGPANLSVGALKFGFDEFDNSQEFRKNFLQTQRETEEREFFTNFLARSNKDGSEYFLDAAQRTTLESESELDPYGEYSNTVEEDGSETDLECAPEEEIEKARKGKLKSRNKIGEKTMIMSPPHHPPPTPLQVRQESTPMPPPSRKKSIPKHSSSKKESLPMLPPSRQESIPMPPPLRKKSMPMPPPSYPPPSKASNSDGSSSKNSRHRKCHTNGTNQNFGNSLPVGFPSL